MSALVDVDNNATRTAPTPDLALYRVPVPEAIEILETRTGGLTAAEVAARLTRHGPNEIVDRGATSPVKLLWEQVTAVMVLILIGASLLSLLLGKFLEAGAIATIVVLFTVLGFVQEYRAERAIAALRRMAMPVVRVTRDAVVTEVPARDLVPGDVVLLEAGNVVPADLRLIEAAALRVQEAALTGESEPIDKTTDVIGGPHSQDRTDVALGDRRNMVYSGTQVTYGRGRGVVAATGMNTELGRIATMLSSVAGGQTPLQIRLDRVGKQLAIAGVVVAAVVMAMGAAGGESMSDLLLTAISVAVAVIPEGLPAVVTFTLAIGAQRMLRRNSLIRKLPAVETLGSVTVICSDKTGTLTQNHMTATVMVLADDPTTLHRVEAANTVEDGESLPAAMMVAIAAGVMCNDADATVDEGGQLVTLGDPTETALLDLAHARGVDVIGLRHGLPRLGEQPFDSERKRMSTAHRALPTGDPDPTSAVSSLSSLCNLLGSAGSDGEGTVIFVKGAPDSVIQQATMAWADGGPVALTEDRRQELLSANNRLAAGGMRVLSLAYRSIPFGTELPAEFEEHLVLVGLVGIIDPPRPEVRDAVATCHRAGIRTVMITGDHPLTATAIAEDLGIPNKPDHAIGNRAGDVLTGAQLDELDAVGLAEAVRNTSVFARVSPAHKLRIVGALQAEGAVVAMTGDGVNDAPALKKADIGVAMGITGTDVSKEASDMVLRDDNFATIVAAVEEGRVIYDNLRRFVKFAVAGNIGKIAVMVGWPIPMLVAGGDLANTVALLPLQLLWLNLMTDGLLGLSLGVEPAEKGVMRRAPHTPGGSLWAGGLAWQTAWIGALIGAAALTVGLAYEAAGNDRWQTMMFTTLAFLQVFQAVGTRSTTESLRSVGLRSNPLMMAIVAAVVGLQLAALYTPLGTFLDLDALSATELATCVLVGAALLFVLEAEKAWRRRAARNVRARHA
ncbi:MAG: cation-translocating P-type ATPase [Acidimicrobiales bacterium]